MQTITDIGLLQQHNANVQLISNI